jgi:hypothetical protein
VELNVTIEEERESAPPFRRCEVCHAEGADVTKGVRCLNCARDLCDRHQVGDCPNSAGGHVFSTAAMKANWPSVERDGTVSVTVPAGVDIVIRSPSVTQERFYLDMPQFAAKKLAEALARAVHDTSVDYATRTMLRDRIRWLEGSAAAVESAKMQIHAADAARAAAERECAEALKRVRELEVEKTKREASPGVGALWVNGEHYDQLQASEKRKRRTIRILRRKLEQAHAAIVRLTVGR